MPLSSSEIAQMNGAYQGMAMNQMAYAGMIGQGPGVYGAPGSGRGADRAVGGMMSGASAAMPLASGAMGLLGLDPMSLGLRAGMGAFGAGAGLGGAAMAGGAVALPLMAAGAGIHHVGSQMYGGAQQQSYLNDTLRSSFNFRNATGGQGFQRSEMSQVGSMVREMSETFGPGGEIMSFRELSGLAGKMGQMGFAQGVKDVKDFTTRFKSMISDIKTMAKDLGTTMEGAMEFAAAAKGSGIFGNRMTSFTGMARQTAVSGGLAMSEVTGAANIGSQISRSIGGLGRQGAVGGMRTIGQIGTAQQMGILSEEDIYNVTGLSGAEGRQAYASSAMQSSARFLQGSRGRRMLASLADKNGTLDESAVQTLLGGGMGISETMRSSKEHLAGVGRANFIRNEGRLRGAALERLGGFMPALQLSEWASSKGIDINDMDDRSMVFAQRQLGMGRDEVDQAIKMANAMPAILEQQRRDARTDKYMSGVSEARKGRGLQGVENRFKQARETINGKIQKLGQDLFNQGAEEIDSAMNKILGEYVETYSKDLDEKYQTMMGGGSAGRSAAQRAFGIGGSGMSKQAEAFMKKASPLSGFGGGGTTDMATLMSKGSEGGLMASLGSEAKAGGLNLITGGLYGLVTGKGGELGRYLLHGQSGVGRLKEAGFDLSGMSSQQMQEKLRSIDDIRRIASSSLDKSLAIQGDQNGEWIRSAYALGSVAGEGDARISSFGKQLEAKGDPALVKQWQSANQAEKARIMANMERGAGIKGEGALASRYGVPPEAFGQLLGRGGKFGSVGEENQAWATAFMGKNAEFGGMSLQQHALGLATGGIGTIADTLTGGKLSNYLGLKRGTSAKQQEMGAFIKGKEFRDLALDLLSGDNDVAEQARKNLGSELGGLSDEQKQGGEAMVKQEMLAGADYMAFLRSKPNGATDAEKKAWAEKNANGRSVEELEGTLGRMGHVVTKQQERDRAEAGKRMRGEGKGELDRMAAFGMYSRDKEGNAVVDAEAINKVYKAGGKEGLAAGDLFQRLAITAGSIAEKQTQIGGTSESAARDRELMDQIQKQSDMMHSMTSGQSAAVKRLVGQQLGGPLGESLIASAGFQERFDKQSRKKGATAAAAEALGMDLSKEEKKMIGDITKGGDVDLFIKRAGIGDPELVKQLREGAKGGKDALRESIEKVTGSDKYREEQKKKKESAQAEKDPLQAKIAANTEKMITAINTAADRIESAVNKSGGGPEDNKGKGGGGHG